MLEPLFFNPYLGAFKKSLSPNDVAILFLEKEGVIL
jgi:hypothetical protein